MKIKNRFFKITYIFFRIILDISKDYSLIRKKGYAYAEKKMKSRHTKRAKQLYKITVELGGVLIKLCQFFSSRRDIFPEPYIEILSKLQDNVPPLSFKKIEEIIHGELQHKRSEFLYIDKSPLASASLGQVHKATLLDGSEVVIKVLKPNIDEDFDRDFAILHFVFKLLSNFKKINQRIDLMRLLHEFTTITGDELNLQREIDVAKAFQEHFKNFSYIKIPHIYEDLCSQKIIVMEEIKGDKLNNISTWIERNNDPHKIAKNIIEAYVEQLLYLQVLHYDPHPGNIIVLENNKIAFLDFGMSGIITDEMKEGVIDALFAFSERDHESIYTILCNFGFIKKDVNKGAMLSVIAFFFDELLDKLNLDRQSVATIDFSPIIKELYELLFSHPFTIPYEWAFIGKTAGILSGVLSFLYPDIKIYEEIKPHIQKLFVRHFKLLMYKKLSSVKTNILQFFELPGKTNALISDIYKGKVQVQVANRDLHSKLSSLKYIITMGITLSFAIVLTIITIVFVLQQRNFNLLLLIIPNGLCIITFLLSFFIYRHKNS